MSILQANRAPKGLKELPRGVAADSFKSELPSMLPGFRGSLES